MIIILDAGSILVVLISGLTLGSLYCLMAMGMTLSFSTMKLFNFSHGAIIMLGAYLTWFLSIFIGLNYLAAIIFMVLGCFVFGMAMEKMILQRLMTKGLMESIIGTLGIALIIENVVLLSFGGRLKRLPILIEGSARLGRSTISYNSLLILICSLGILVAMAYFLKRTRFGMAMRAIAQDKEASYIVGIPISRINMCVFGIGAALAGLSGIFLGSIYFMTPAMGAEALIKAFIICVLGGLGSIKGTILAAYIIGIVESLTALIIGIYWTPVVLFVFMMTVLIFRPSGLFGEEVQ